MSSVRDDLGPAVSGIEGERLLAPPLRPAPGARRRRRQGGFTPYALLVPSLIVLASDHRLAADPALRHVVPEVRPRADLRRSAGVRRPRQLRGGADRSRVLAGSRPVCRAGGGLRRRDDDPRRPGRPADEAPRRRAAHARVGRSAAGLGDAAAVGDDRLGLDLRHAVRSASTTSSATGSDSRSRGIPGSSTRSASSSWRRSSSCGAPCRSSRSRVYAGLTQVPDEVLEAAQLDGANGFKSIPVRRPAGHPAHSRDRHDPAGHLGSACLHADLRAAVDRRPRRGDQHSRRLHLPRLARLR